MFPVIAAFVAFLLLLAANSYGRDVSFIWSANPETVDGYRVYYKTGSSGAPYNGTGAAEGSSPVAAGNVTSFTLHGLSDTETYYFALTAYRGEDESVYSTEIVLSAETPPAVGRDVSFAWTANPETVDGYKLYYKTGSSGPPYDGTGATEGDSPILTGNVTTFTLHGLSDTETYYFTLTAYQGEVESNYTAVIVLPPSSVNSPPTANNAMASVIEDTPLSGQLSATDLDGNALTYSIVANGTKGSAVITNSTTGAYTYTPSPNQTGSDSFTYRANDGTVNSNTATVAVTIMAVNDAPTATGTSVTTSANVAVSGQLSATDPDGNALTYTIVTNGTKGSAAITNPATGAFTYTPSENQSGSDSFTFRANDGTVNSNTATVAVTITAVNIAPTATGTSVTTKEDTPVSGQLSATDPDGNALTYTIVTNGTKGSAAITNPATGAFTYTPS
ncbi:MAG: Ig-like domain-containing protein, partial [Desulfobulbaceae bacterium]